MRVMHGVKDKFIYYYCGNSTELTNFARELPDGRQFKGAMRHNFSPASVKTKDNNQSISKLTYNYIDNG